jgi:GNAT superfamily N-acetyltransferase
MFVTDSTHTPMTHATGYKGKTSVTNNLLSSPTYPKPVIMEIQYELVEDKKDILGMPCYEHRFDGMVVSTDSTRVDMDFVLRSLKQAYWANNRPESMVRQAWAHSMGLGIYDEKTGEQVAMMRVVTDYAVYAHFFDVWVDPNHRGKGYSKVMLSFVMSYPGISSVFRFQLSTSDAHTLYRQYGFDSLRNPDRFLEAFKTADGNFKPT